MIRPATTADAAEVCALWNPFIRDTSTTFNSVEKSLADIAAMIETRARSGHTTFVAHDGALAGFATYAQFRGGVGYSTCMEHTIVLAPAAQGRGIGRALMTALESHARCAGAHQMIAGVSAENADGIAFHTRLSYVLIATIPQAGHKFGRFIDLVLMQKFLS